MQNRKVTERNGGGWMNEWIRRESMMAEYERKGWGEGRITCRISVTC